MKCILVGVGHHSPLKDQICRMVADAGIGSDFIMLPWVKPAETAAILAHCECFVLTSRYEGLPFSVIEAMALGKPVVATDVPGTRDIVDHGMTGLLCPSNDHAAVANSVVNLLESSDLRTRMAQAAKEHYLRNYRTETCIGELERLYTSVCAEYRRVRPNCVQSW